MEKRKNPFPSSIAFTLQKRQNLSVDAGREWNDVTPINSLDPSIHDSLSIQNEGTDFNKWSPNEIKEFLDVRGGDYDDCLTFSDLVEKAIEVEINTGTAYKPGSKKQSARDNDDDYNSTRWSGKPSGDIASNEDEIDPLDSFMAGLSSTSSATAPRPVAHSSRSNPSFPHTSSAASSISKSRKKSLACDDEQDPGVEFMGSKKSLAQRVAAAAATAGYDSDEEVYAAAAAMDGANNPTMAGGAAANDSDDDSDDDSDRSLSAEALQKRMKKVDSLPPVDHSLITYEDFAKDFYEESPSVRQLSNADVTNRRRALEIRVAGAAVPRPILTFSDCSLDPLLREVVDKSGFSEPTPIQAQALPAALSGRDVLGVAKTGSGKTAAFILPLLQHLLDQRALEKGEGPVGIILAPTRELSEQIHREIRRFAKPYGIRAAAAFGGLSKFDQMKALRQGVEVAVATPGRLIDLIKSKACPMNRVTFLVIDEADRMLDMGFEPQVRSIAGQIRPDRQVLLFTATLPRKIERLVTDLLTNPVRITVGMLGVANADVRQCAVILTSESDKAEWLTQNVSAYVDEGDVIIFASQRSRVDTVQTSLVAAGVRAVSLHGDLDQHARMRVLDAFRAGKEHVLVATDVLARGLDVRTIKTVICFDAARDMDTHVHRVGRAGRAGDKEGVAVSLLVKGVPEDARFAAGLIPALVMAGQEVAPDLYDLAMKDPHFQRGCSRRKGGRRGGGGGEGGGKKRIRSQIGGAGLGFGEEAGDGKGGFTMAAAAAAAAAATTTTTTAAAATMAPASSLSREVRGGVQGGRGVEAKADRSEYESKLPPPPPLASLTATPRTSLPPPPHTLLGSTAVKSTSGMFVKSSLVVGGDTGKVTVSYGNSALRQQGSGTARTSPTMSSFIPGREAGTQHTMSSTAIIAPKSLQMNQANGSNAFVVTKVTTSTSATSKIPSSGPISVDDVPLYLSRQQRPSYNNRPAYNSLSSSSSSYTGCSQNQQSTLQRLGVDNDAAMALARANAEAIAAKFSAQLANNQSDPVVRSTNDNNQDLNSSYPPSNPTVSKSRWDRR